MKIDFIHIQNFRKLKDCRIDISIKQVKEYLFTYIKLLKVSATSQNYWNEIMVGKVIVLDRTLRLFYVLCSRAKESLAIIAYTSNPESVKATLLANDWFEENEIEII